MYNKMISQSHSKSKKSLKKRVCHKCYARHRLGKTYCRQTSRYDMQLLTFLASSTLQNYAASRSEGFSTLEMYSSLLLSGVKV